MSRYEGERCPLCHAPATRKVAEELVTRTNPFHARHPLTARVCEDCFVRLFGPLGAALSADMDRHLDELEKESP